MKIFVTGATGWVGAAVVDDLLGAGHAVVGLARSPEKGNALAAKGATVAHGDLLDLDRLRDAAAAADAVIHTAFNHDFSRYAKSAAEDRAVIEALGAALEGSDRPLVVTSGLSGLPRDGDETDHPDANTLRQSEAAARAVADRGVRVAAVRLAPSVHGAGDHAFIPLLIDLARKKGVSAYLGEGDNAWSGVHRLDAARMYRLVLEEGLKAPIYHAVAEEHVPFRAIAEAIGRKLGLPVEARDADHFGWFASMAGADMAVSSAATRKRVGWTPTGPGLLDDLLQDDYEGR